MPQAFSPNPFMPLKVLDFCNLKQSVASSFLQETAELTGISLIPHNLVVDECFE
jgi:hypothetical protein